MCAQTGELESRTESLRQPSTHYTVPLADRHGWDSRRTNITWQLGGGVPVPPRRAPSGTVIEKELRVDEGPRQGTSTEWQAEWRLGPPVPPDRRRSSHKYEIPYSGRPPPPTYPYPTSPGSGGAVALAVVRERELEWEDDFAYENSGDPDLY